ncbi:NUDIX hydrolase [Bermanella sp. R86510]|uniref:NUDIX hydrolase n=1 Tax=unclassified Bermanella TaxID=2627862 RepID=UPI0037CB9EF9
MLLKALVSGVQQHQPRTLEISDLAQAAVLVAVTDSQHPEVILTLRSQQMPTHQGEVAFPGGKCEPDDEDLIATALREANEEIGLDPNVVEVIGPMSQVVSRFGFLVTPILAVVPHDVVLSNASDEIEAYFRVPLHFFTDGEPDDIDQFGTFKGPRWQYEHYTIWGLTAVMLAEMLNEFCGTEFELVLGHLQEHVDLVIDNNNERQ